MLVVAGIVACGPAPQPAPKPAPQPATQPAAAAQNQSTSVGDTSRYGVRILGVGYGPSRVSLVLHQAAYLTIVAVTDDRILALVPAAGGQSTLLDAGAVTIPLGATAEDSARDGRSGRRDESGSVGSAAAEIEYTRCLARAQSAARARTRKVLVGRDSQGNPIYQDVGPDPAEFERACRRPEINGARPAEPDHAGAQYLLVFASDTPVSNQDILDLVVTAGDARSTAMAVGTKLFTAGRGVWAASFVPW